MDAVKRLILGALPNIAESVTSDILAKLEACGVTNVDDMQFLEESDLSACNLTPIQIRRIISAAKTSGVKDVPTPQVEAANQREQCVVFIDDSNLYIEGQKYFARLHNLLVPQDPRCRIDIGKLVDIALNDRKMCKGSTLYGSEPPARDTVWKKIGETLDVRTFQKSKKGKEKEVDTALTADSVAYACKRPPKIGHQTVIIVAGDRDYCPAVKNITEEGWTVEILAFSSSISAYWQKMKGKRCKIFELDEVLKTSDRSCCFVERKWIIDKCPLPINMTRVIQLDKDTDEGSDKVKKLVDVITELTRVPSFYHLISDIKKVYIIGFLPKDDSFTSEQQKTRENLNKATMRKNDCRTTSPKTSERDFFDIWKSKWNLIAKTCIDIGICKSIQYTDLKTAGLQKPTDEDSKDTKLENRFNQLEVENCKNESDDDEDYSLLEANIVDRVMAQKSEDQEEDDLNAVDDTGFTEVKVKRCSKVQPNPIYPKQCRYKFGCHSGITCYYTHTYEENKFFADHDGKGYKGYKSKPCNYHFDPDKRCKHENNSPMCAYYHSNTEAHCYKCNDTGHAAHDKAGPVCSKLE